MALINISDETRNKINLLVVKEKLKNPQLKITQDYIISKAIDYKYKEEN